MWGDRGLGFEGWREGRGVGGLGPAGGDSGLGWCPALDSDVGTVPDTGTHAMGI